MRLLFINSSLTGGGSERAMSLLANESACYGHVVEMLLVRDKEKTYEIDPSISLKELHYSSSNKFSILAERMNGIRGAVRDFKPDCVISFMWDINIIVLLSLLGMKTNVIISERAFSNSPRRNRAIKLLEYFTCLKAKQVVYQTDYAKSIGPKTAESKSVVIPNMVVTPKGKERKKELGYRVVSVGRLTAQKNFKLLINSFKDLLDTHPEFVLEIYGEGDLRDELSSQIEELGITDNVRLKGYVSDVTSQIQSAYMFVLPSNYEGISNAMIEAMSLGLAVICTDCPVGGAAAMINDMENGILVPVDDQNELSSSMRLLADNAILAKQLGDAASEVIDDYSPEVVFKKWNALFDKMIS